MTQRLDTFDADDGRCVGCARPQSRGATAWAWQAHHVIKAQRLRMWKVPAARIRDATFTVLACRRCHEQHENRTRPIPFENLPARVVQAVESLGPRAEDTLRRYHPPTDAGRISA